MKWLLFVAFVVLVLIVLAAILYLLYAPLPGATARRAEGQRQTLMRDGRTLVYYRRGRGERILLAASAGREASDFNELTDALVAAGYRTIAVEAPGIGGASAVPASWTLFDLAEDIRAVDEAEQAEQGGGAATVIGHAFGNRVMRAFTSRYPDRVEAVILLAAGGKRPPPARADRALKRAFDPRLTAARRLANIRYAFFAGNNPLPAYWHRGWHRHTAQMQGAATAAVQSECWWSAGDMAPILVVQASNDRIAPKADTADLLLAELPHRVRVAVIADAGHALLPEKPAEIATAVLDFLQTVKKRRIAPPPQGRELKP